MLATKAATCGQLVLLLLCSVLVSESRIHQGHEERDSGHLLCSLWRVLCGRRDDSTVDDSKQMKVKCESKLCYFWHTFLSKKDNAFFHHSLQSSSSVEIPDKYDDISFQKWRIIKSRNEKNLTKFVNNSSVLNGKEFNQVGVPYRVPDSLLYYINSHFSSRSLKEHSIDDSLNKASFFNPNEKYEAKHLINANTYINGASKENNTKLMFNNSESYSFNESVISSTLTKDKISKDQISYAGKETDTMPNLESVYGNIAHNRTSNVKINFDDTQPFSEINVTASKNTESNLLTNSSESNFSPFSKASYANNSDVVNNKTVLFGANADDFQYNSSNNSPNNASFKKIVYSPKESLGIDGILQKENASILTTKLNEYSTRNKNAPEFELETFKKIEKMNSSYISLTTETEAVTTKEEKIYGTASYDLSSTRVKNTSQENSVLTELKSSENFQNITSNENSINKLNSTNISLNKPESNSFFINSNNTASSLNSGKSEANTRINNDEFNANIKKLNATNISREYIFESNFYNNKSKTPNSYSGTSNSVKQPLSVEKREFDSDIPEMLDSGMDNFQIPENAQLNSNKYPTLDFVSKELKEMGDKMQHTTGVNVSYNLSIVTHSNETDKPQSVKSNFDDDDSASETKTSTFSLNSFSSYENDFHVTETPKDLLDKKLENSMNSTIFFNEKTKGMKVPFGKYPPQVDEIQNNDEFNDRGTISLGKSVNLNITAEPEEENMNTSVKEEYFDHDYSQQSFAVTNKDILNMDKTRLREKTSTENPTDPLAQDHNTPHMDRLNISTLKQVELSRNNNLDSINLAAIAHFNESITLTVPPDFMSTKQSTFYQSHLSINLFPDDSANVLQDSDQEKLSRNTKFSTMNTIKINTNAEAVDPTNNDFSASNKPSSQNQNGKEFQMTNIEISAANENQNFNSAFTTDIQTDLMNGKHDEVRKSENKQLETENHDGNQAKNFNFLNEHHGFGNSTEESKGTLSIDDQNDERKNIWTPTKSDLSLLNENKEKVPAYYSATFSNDESAITSSDLKPSSFTMNEAHTNALLLQKDMGKTTGVTTMTFNTSSVKEIESNTLNYKSSTPLKDGDFIGSSLTTKHIGEAKIAVKTDTASLQGFFKTPAYPKMANTPSVTKETDSIITAPKVTVLDAIDKLTENNLNESRNVVHLSVKLRDDALEAKFVDSSASKLMTNMKNASAPATTLNNEKMYTSNPLKELHDAMTSSKTLHETENTTINSFLSSAFESKEITENIGSEIAYTISESFSETDNSKTITQYDSTITANELPELFIGLSKTTQRPHFIGDKKNSAENSEEDLKITGSFQSTVETNFATEELKESTKNAKVPQSTDKASLLTENPREPSIWTHEASFITKNVKETPEITEKSKYKTNHQTENAKGFSEPTEWFHLKKEFITEDYKLYHKISELPQSITDTKYPTDNVEEPIKISENTETTVEINYSADYSKAQTETTAMIKPEVETNRRSTDLETSKTAEFLPSTPTTHYLIQEAEIPYSEETTLDVFSSDLTKNEENINDIEAITNEIPKSTREPGYLTSKENFLLQRHITESTLFSSVEGNKTEPEPFTKMLNPTNNSGNLPINLSNELLKTFKAPIMQKESKTHHRQAEPEIFSNTEIDFSTTNADTVTLPSSDIPTKILISNREKARKNLKDSGFPHRKIPDESVNPFLDVYDESVTTTTEFTTNPWHKWGRTADPNQFIAIQNEYTATEDVGGLNSKGGPNDKFDPTTEAEGSLKDLIIRLTSPTTVSSVLPPIDMMNDKFDATTEAEGSLKDLIIILTSPTTVSSGLPLTDMIKDKFDPTTEAEGELNDLINGFTSPTTVSSELSLADMITDKFNPTTEAEGSLKDLIIRLTNPTTVSSGLPLTDMIKDKFDTITEAEGGLNDLINGFTSPTTVSSELSLADMINDKFDPTTEAEGSLKDLIIRLTSPTTVSSGLPLTDMTKDKFDPITEAEGGLNDLINGFTSPTTVSSELSLSDMINEKFIPTTESEGSLKDLIIRLTSPTTVSSGLPLTDMTKDKFDPITEAEGGLNDLINGFTRPTTVSSELSLSDMINEKFIPTTEAEGSLKDLIIKLTSPTTVSSGLSLNEMIPKRFDGETTSSIVASKGAENSFIPQVTNDASLIRTERDTEKTLDSDIIRTERDLSSFGDGQFESNLGVGTPQLENNISSIGQGQLGVSQGFPTSLPVNKRRKNRVNKGLVTSKPQNKNSSFEENQFGVRHGFGTQTTPEGDDDMLNFRTGNVGTTGNYNLDGKTDLNGNSNTDSESNPNTNLSGDIGFGKKDSRNNNFGIDMTTPSNDFFSTFPSVKQLPSTSITNFESNSEVDVEYKDFDDNPLSRRTKTSGGNQETTSFSRRTTAVSFDASQNPPNERQSSSASTQESGDSTQSTVATTESSIIPFHFTIDADYDEVVGSRKTKFEENLTKQLAVAMRVPLDCVQNMKVKKGSIEVNFDLVPNSEHGHLADEKALKAAAEELKRMIDNGQLTIKDLDGKNLVVVPLDPPTYPPPASNMEHTTLILGVVIGAFILTVITVAIAAIVYKRKSSGDHRLSPIEEARSKLPSYREIPFQEALFMKGSGRHKMMMGKYCYNTGQWLGPGPEPKLFHPPESVVYRPPTDSEIRRTPRPPTAVRERLKYDWEVDWDSMVSSR